jgi:arthrofactin-type cyclic lipopeptide synthetase C
LTPNGKVNRQALPAPGFEAHSSRQYEAPVGEVECTLAALWATVLKLERVGRHDNFFELGGTSLLALRVIARSDAGLPIGWKLQDLYSAPTIARLADRYKQHLEHGPAPAGPAPGEAEPLDLAAFLTN